MKPSLKTAVSLSKLGYWSHLIHPNPPEWKPGGKSQKRPIGKEWGIERWTEEKIRDTEASFPGAGVGISFGPGRAPGGGWLADLEGDGEQAAESLARLLGGESIDTPSWGSARGNHTLFIVDGERLLALLLAAGAVERKGIAAGVWHLPEFPGLEWRIGGCKADGTVKQIQSVCPPTIGDDGNARVWRVTPKTPVAPLPESAYALLDTIAERKAIQEESPRSGGNGEAPRAKVATGKDVIEKYVASAIKLECDAVSTEKPNNRNNRLNNAAHSLGTLAGWPEMSESLARSELLRAALSSGLDQGESERTIESGWTAGSAKPRDRSSVGTKASRNGSNGAASTGPALSTNGDGHDQAEEGPAEEEAPINKTDLGNARRMVKMFGDRIRYCYPWKAWFVWDGTRWKRDDTGEIFRLAKKTVQAIGKEATAIDDDDRRKALMKWALISEGKKEISYMVTLAESEPGIAVTADTWDRNGWLFNTAKGTIDLKTGSLHGHDRQDYITKICPVEFDANAKCDLWKDTLSLFLKGNTGLINYFQEICGYALVGEVQDHILPVCHGNGQNGKSTILGTLLETFGPDYAMKCPPEMLMSKGYDSHPTDRADLFGKRLVIAIETEQGRRLNETLVKELTGGDRIRARRMREDFWEFSPTHTVIMGTNHKPVVQGTDHAIWRRLRLVPFSVTVEAKKDDKGMPHKLKAERAGILAWCLEGALRWQKNGLSEPPEVVEATRAYRAEQDILGSFIAEHGLQDPSVRVRCGEFYARYKKWAEDSGEQVLTMKAFGMAMQERGFEVKTSNGKWYLGIALRRNDEDETDS